MEKLDMSSKKEMLLNAKGQFDLYGPEGYLEYQRQRAASINEKPKDREEFDCLECYDRGYILEVSEAGNLRSVECACKERRAVKRALEASGMTELFQKHDFPSFREHTPWAGEMKRVALEWAKQGTGWLVLCGQSGCGKTHLGIAACGYRLGRRIQKVEFLPWREFVTSQINQNNPDREKQMEKMQQAPLLYVDDLLKTAGEAKGISSWELRLCFELINYRYNNRLDTVITTEWLPQELLQLDESIGSRIVERAGESLVAVERDRQKNYRLRGATGVA